MKSLKREREFLPAALEIVDTPPNPAGRSILWAIVGFFLLTIIWAVCGEVDIVAVARGKVVPQGYSKVIQPLEIGTVKAIRVQDGQTVAAGQILVELDDSAAAADAARWEADRVVARQEANRLRRLAEWSMHAKGLPATIPGPQLSDPLILAQWHEHESSLARLRAQAAEREAELQTARQQLAKLEVVLPLIEKRAKNERQLADKQLFSEQEYLKTEQERLEAQHDLKRQRRRLVALEESLLAIRLQADHTTQSFRRQMLERLQERERQIATLDQELAKARRRQALMTLTAPVSGVVQQLAVHTEGAVVKPAQPLMVIVPKDAELVVEAQVANKDIGFVAEGQQAEIKVDAFPFTQYGTLDGTVATLSDEAVQDETQRLIYRSIVHLADTALQVENRFISLSPGMAVSVEVKTGKRRLIEYFLSPLLRYRSESVRER